MAVDFLAVIYFNHPTFWVWGSLQLLLQSCPNSDYPDVGYSDTASASHLEHDHSENLWVFWPRLATYGVFEDTRQALLKRPLRGRLDCRGVSYRPCPWRSAWRSRVTSITLVR